MKNAIAIFALLLVAPLARAESVRLAWDAPAGVAVQRYAVLIYEGASTACADHNWTKATWEDGTTATNTVVTRAPGCYEFTVSYYLNNQIQGCRSNFVAYQIKPGEVAAPAPPPSTPPPIPMSLRIP